jgi:hypothetical protein
MRREVGSAGLEPASSGYEPLALTIELRAPEEHLPHSGCLNEGLSAKPVQAMSVVTINREEFQWFVNNRVEMAKFLRFQKHDVPSCIASSYPRLTAWMRTSKTNMSPEIAAKVLACNNSAQTTWGRGIAVAPQRSSREIVSQGIAGRFGDAVRST